MNPSGHPESTNRLGSTQQRFLLAKPPYPTLAALRSRNQSSIEVQLPPLIAGALIAAFAAAVGDALNNELLTHYYLSDQRLKINLDRVLDRLLADFTTHLWDELFDFYHASNADHGQQVSLLFDGPIRQIVLILNGPEVSRCILDKIAPGLSRRPLTWTEAAKGIDQSLALQLVCGFWHREFASRSPGGNPDDIARSIGSRLITGNAFNNFIAQVKKNLFTPHYVQLYLMETTVWDIICKRPHRPPPDGFHVVQFRFEFDFSQRLATIDGANHVDIGTLPVITGSPNECGWSTVASYASRCWPRCGKVVLQCLNEALVSAAQSQHRGEGFYAMSFWDDSDHETLSPGLRLLHVEVETGTIRLTASAWLLVLVDVLQQMAWTCATLSSSPFPEGLAESSTQISSWDYQEESTFINCSLAHRAVSPQEASSWTQPSQGSVVAAGFPLGEHRISNTQT
jgi:hypothetical protein